jgi:branched-chain amino acid transport system ATP-binding protein
MRELKGAGLAILLVEQNLYSALSVADRIYVLETGRVVYECRPGDVAGDPGALSRYLGVQ